MQLKHQARKAGSATLNARKNTWECPSAIVPPTLTQVADLLRCTGTQGHLLFLRPSREVLRPKKVAGVVFHRLLRMDPRAVRSVFNVLQKRHAQYFVFPGNEEYVTVQERVFEGYTRASVGHFGGSVGVRKDEDVGKGAVCELIVTWHHEFWSCMVNFSKRPMVSTQRRTQSPSTYPSAPCSVPLRLRKSITATTTSKPPSGFRITKRPMSP